MPFKPFTRVIRAAFLAHTLTWTSPVRKIKYIGPYLETNLNNQNIHTVFDVVNYVDQIVVGMPGQASAQQILDTIRNSVGHLVRNNRGHQCTQMYLARPLNRFGFNVLIDLLDYAKTRKQATPHANWLNALDLTRVPLNLIAKLLCEFNEGLAFDATNYNTPCRKTPARGSVGAEPSVQAMRRCPCITNAANCNGPCLWTADNGGACVARYARARDFRQARDINGFVGDWDPSAVPLPGHRRPTARYVRRPADPTGAFFALPLVQEASDEEADDAEA